MIIIVLSLLLFNKVEIKRQNVYVCPRAYKKPNQGSSVAPKYTGVSGEHKDFIKCDNCRATTNCFNSGLEHCIW